MKEKYKSLGLPFQPIMVVIGTDFQNLKDFYVHYNSISYKANSFLKCVDICFKIHHVLNINYAEESTLVWQFLANYIYKLTSKHDVKNSKLLTFMKDIDLAI